MIFFLGSFYAHFLLSVNIVQGDLWQYWSILCSCCSGINGVYSSGMDYLIKLTLIHWLINNENGGLQPDHIEVAYFKEMPKAKNTMKWTCFFFSFSPADTSSSCFANVNNFTLKALRGYKNHYLTNKENTLNTSSRPLHLPPLGTTLSFKYTLAWQQHITLILAITHRAGPVKPRWFFC